MSPVFSKYQREIKVGNRLGSLLTSDVLTSMCSDLKTDIIANSQGRVKNEKSNMFERPIESGLQHIDQQENGCILEDIDISSEIEPKAIPEEIWDKDTFDDLFEPCASFNAQQNSYWYIKGKEDLLKECIEACPEHILKSKTFFHPASSNMQPSYYQLVASKTLLSSGPEFPIEDGQFEDI